VLQSLQLLSTMLKGLSLLIVQIVIIILICLKNSEAYSNYESIVEAALEGYDPRIANPFNIQDPGRKMKIFKNWFSDNKYSLPEQSKKFLRSSMFDRLYSFRVCNPNYVRKTIRSYQEYLNTMWSNIAFVSERDLISINESPADELKQYFQDGKTITIFRADCISNALGISSFVTPDFTNSFLESLKKIESGNDNDIEIFYNRFGTHYMKSVYLGSSVIVEVKNADVEKHEGLEDIENRIKKLFITDNFSLNKDSYQFRVISLGAPPTGQLNDWITQVEKSPVPIKFELEKISTYLSKPWIGSIQTEAREDLAAISEKLLAYEDKFIEKRITRKLSIQS